MALLHPNIRKQIAYRSRNWSPYAMYKPKHMIANLHGTEKHNLLIILPKKYELFEKNLNEIILSPAQQYREVQFQCKV